MNQKRMLNKRQHAFLSYSIRTELRGIKVGLMAVCGCTGWFSMMETSFSAAVCPMKSAG